MHLTRIGLTPLKGARHTDLDRVHLDPTGPRGDRLYCLLETGRNRVLRTVNNPTMVLVTAAWDGADLTVTTPGEGTVTATPLPTGEVRTCSYWDRAARLEVMTSPHADQLSAHLGRHVRLARIRTAGEVVYGGSVTLVTTGALRRLGEAQDSRFRATFTVAAEQDPEPGTFLQVGGATVRVRGPVPRCRVVDINPDTAALDTRHLHTIAGQGRAERDVPFGIDADVVTPGEARLGDAVTPVPSPG